MRFQRTLTGSGELLALLRPLWCFIAVVSFGQGVGLLPAWAAPSYTITTLSVTSGGNQSAGAAKPFEAGTAIIGTFARPLPKK
jgi:hypothetical protein